MLILRSFSYGKLNVILEVNTTKGIALSDSKKNVSLQKKLDACNILTIKVIHEEGKEEGSYLPV